MSKKIKPRAKKVKPTLGAFPIVAIGAAEGGPAAAVQLLKNLPADTGMAFVYIQHYGQGEDHVVETLSRVSKMKVVPAQHQAVIAPNQVYVQAAGEEMTINGTRLMLGGTSAGAEGCH